MRRCAPGLFALSLSLAGCGDDSSADDGDASVSESTDGSTATSTTDIPWSTTSDDTETASTTGSNDATGSTDPDGSSSTDDSTTGAVAGCVVFVDGATGDDTLSGNNWVNPKATIIAALEAATVAGEPCDVWVAAGTYHASSRDDPTDTLTLIASSGLYGGFAGHESSVDERDITANETILSGDIGVVGDVSDNTHHIVTVALDSRIDGFTIVAGHAVNDQAPFGGQGAAIFNPFGGDFTVANCTVRDNATETGSMSGVQPGWGGDGAALWSGGGIVTIVDSVFENNVAADGGTDGTSGGFGGNGGAIFAFGGLRIFRSRFSNNRAGNGGFGNGGFGGSGGAIYFTASEDVVIVDTLFEENLAGASGYPDDPELHAGTGGALRLHAMGTTLIAIANSAFERNASVLGATHIATNGAAADGTFSVVNTVFSQNTATSAGAGGLFYHGDGRFAFSVAQCTFEGNTAGPGGAAAIFYRNSEDPGTQPAELVGSILWNNPATFGPPLLTTPGFMGPAIPLSVDASVIEGGCTSSETLICGTVLDVDPMFVDALGGNLRLQAGSPAQDQGDMTLLPPDLLDLDEDGDTAEPLPIDADGNDRVSGPEVDIGAYELP
jgi:hypothetical protein